MLDCTQDLSLRSAGKHQRVTPDLPSTVLCRNIYRTYLGALRTAQVGIRDYVRPTIIKTELFTCGRVPVSTMSYIVILARSPSYGYYAHEGARWTRAR